MRQLRVAGVGSTVPLESIARAPNVCRPLERPRYVTDARHDRQGRRSSLHWKREPDFVDTMWNDAVRERVVLGGPP